MAVNVVHTINLHAFVTLRLSRDYVHEHRDSERPPKTEELSDIYDPNVYTGAPCLSPTSY